MKVPCGVGIFLVPNANIMLVVIAIRMKCSLITKNKMFFKLVFFKFLLHINTELRHFCLSCVWKD